MASWPGSRQVRLSASPQAKPAEGAEIKTPLGGVCLVMLLYLKFVLD